MGTDELHPPLTLMYHAVDRITHDVHAISVTPARFAQQMAWLHRRGLRGVSMSELLQACDDGARPGLVGLTFDDGYRSVLEGALPVLESYGFTATVFAVSGLTGQHNAWDPDGPRCALMSAVELAELPARGIEIGSHGHRHVSLAGLPVPEVAAEVTTSRAVLAEITGSEPEGFCYPYGHVDQPAIDAVRRAGYQYACAVDPAAPHAGRFAWPRRYVGEADGALRLRAKQLVHRRHRRIGWSA